MEIFSTLLSLCEGIHQLLMDCPHNVPVMQSFDDVLGDISLNKLDSGFPQLLKSQIKIQICFKIMGKSLNFIKSSWNL